MPMILGQVLLIIIELYDSGAGIQDGRRAKRFDPDCARGSMASCAPNLKMPHNQGKPSTVYRTGHFHVS